VTLHCSFEDSEHKAYHLNLMEALRSGDLSALLCRTMISETIPIRQLEDSENNGFPNIQKFEIEQSTNKSSKNWFIWLTPTVAKPALSRKSSAELRWIPIAPHWFLLAPSRSRPHLLHTEQFEDI